METQMHYTATQTKMPKFVSQNAGSSRTSLNPRVYHFDTKLALRILRLVLSLVLMVATHLIASYLVENIEWRLPNETILPSLIALFTLKVAFWTLLLAAVWQLLVVFREV